MRLEKVIQERKKCKPEGVTFRKFLVLLNNWNIFRLAGIEFSGMKMHEMKLERQWARSCQSFNNSY